MASLVNGGMVRRKISQSPVLATFSTQSIYALRRQAPNGTVGIAWTRFEISR